MRYQKDMKHRVKLVRKEILDKKLMHELGEEQTPLEVAKVVLSKQTNDPLIQGMLAEKIVAAIDQKEKD